MRKILLLSLFLSLSACQKDEVGENQEEDNTSPLNYGTVIDQDNNQYATIEIGKQIWMAENLKTTTYCNGDSISNIVDDDEWSNINEAGWSYLENDSGHDSLFGKLYNWLTVYDERNICPCGWHVPTDAEWKELIDYLGGPFVAGGKMKSKGNLFDGTGLWTHPNHAATNESGFSGLPGGYREVDGEFRSRNNFTFWWSSSEENEYFSIGFALRYNFGDVITAGYANKKSGFSIRCIKNR